MREIALSRGLIALVDDDFDGIGAKWYPIKSGATHYVQRYVPVDQGGPGREKMHHAIIGKPPMGMVVDHIDGNGLNNTRANLRIVTKRQNQQNQVLSTHKKHSKHPGVSWANIRGWERWVAGAKFNGKRKTIGYFDTEEAAFAAYQAAVAAHGVAA